MAAKGTCCCPEHQCVWAIWVLRIGRDGEYPKVISADVVGSPKLDTSSARQMSTDYWRVKKYTWCLEMPRALNASSAPRPSESCRCGTAADTASLRAKADVRAHIKREHEAGQAKPVRARGAARAARPNNNSNRRCRDNNNNINNSNEDGSGESVNSISSQNDGATAADTIGTDRSAAPSRSAKNRREEEDGPEEDSPGPTIMRTRRAARQRLPSMSDTDDDSINTSVHEQQQQHQLARNNLSVSPDVQRHQHVTTRTQAATATSPDSGSVTPLPTPLSSRVTNANVSHSPESPRRTLRPRAAATQQPRLQTTSRAWRATSVPAESQGSQRQQRLPKRTLQPTQESAEGRRSTTSTATQRAAAPSTTSRQQRSTSPTALARRSGSTQEQRQQLRVRLTSRKSGSSPPAVRTTRAERLRLENVPGDDVQPCGSRPPTLSTKNEDVA
ncbi:unnamed protein product [Trichogramma brassicae]|uniref:Uncharacterized protein n=1 Tax=Trichogramma brassicae TaxID=86971 RepID=A0A6H5J4D8_9HYME|nr:unnamed protein product [Trichogramma brassicae]